MTHAIGVRADWQMMDRRMDHARRRIGWSLAGVMAGILLCIFVAEQLVERVAFQAALSDAGTWSLACGAAIAYALRHRPERRREALTVALLAGASFVVADLVVKWQVASWIPPEMRRSPLLFWGVWQLGMPAALIWVAWRYPQELRAVGFSLDHAGRNVLVGIAGGAALAGHFFFSVAFTGAGQMQWPPFPDVFWQLCFELATTMGAELFFRGTLYRYLESDRQIGAWWAALISAACHVSIFLLKAQWMGDAVTAAGVIFYISMVSIISAMLYRWTRSLIPSYISALIFNLTAIGYG